MYAIVEIAGKQYKVQENDKLFVPHLADAKVDDTIEFDRVLLVTDGDDVQVGTPLVADAAVSATVLEHVKADKILVFRKIRRKRFKVKKGHRQRYTQIQVGAVSLNGKKQSSTSKEKSAESTAAEARSSAAAAKKTGKAEATQAKTKSATKDSGKTEATQAKSKSATKDSGKTEAAQAKSKSATNDSGSPEAKQDEPKETTVSKKGGDDETKDSADAAGKKKSGKSAEKERVPESDAGPKQAQDADESADSDDAEKSS